MTLEQWRWVSVGLAEVILTAVFSMQPFIMARAVLFGVYVPEEARGDAKVRSLRRRFSLAVWLAALIIVALAEAIVAGGRAEVALPPTLGLELLAFVVVYIRFHRLAVKMKAAQDLFGCCQCQKGGKPPVPSEQGDNRLRLVHTALVHHCGMRRAGSAELGPHSGKNRHPL
jgi:hypothetical protein